MTKAPHAYAGLVAIGFALAGCMQPAATTPTATDPQVGATLVDPVLAGQMFAQVCLTSGPRFRAAPAALAAYPMTQSAQTGTYFHNQYNLSVNVNAERCSFVFATNQPTDTVVGAMAQGTASILTTPLPPGIDLTSSQAADGLTYFRGYVPAQN